MIIYRYLAREVLTTMLAASLIILLITLSTRFVGYLADAAAGELDGGVLLTLMAYRLPAYFELILPLGLFLGILMAYGRLYIDSEMTVLHACGMSQTRLVMYTVCTALIVAVIVGFFSLYLSPKGVSATESLLAEQRSRTDFETLKPMRFHQQSGGKSVSYAESISDDKEQLQRVFMATSSTSASVNKEIPIVLTAESGETIIDEKTGVKYLYLKNGRRYQGVPGSAMYEVVSFDTYSQILPKPDFSQVRSKNKTDAISTRDLLADTSLQAKAALQWRLSLPFLVLVVALLAVPLSYTKPRGGRYGKMLPSVLLYVIYLVCVNGARGVIEEGTAPVAGLLWVVHGGFFVLAIFMLTGKTLWARLFKGKAKALKVAS